MTAAEFELEPLDVAEEEEDEEEELEGFELNSCADCVRFCSCCCCLCLAEFNLSARV